jgi:hypothetical protein
MPVLPDITAYLAALESRILGQPLSASSAPFSFELSTIRSRLLEGIELWTHSGCCALRVLDRHRNNGRANQGDAKDQHGKCQNQGTHVDQPDRTIRALGSR